MKNLSLTLPLFALFAMLAVPGCGGETEKKLAYLPFNTAVIKYEISGSLKGEEILYIKGDHMASHKYVSQGADEENTLELSLGSEKYMADLIKMTAVKENNDEYAGMITMSKEDQLKYNLRNALGLKSSDAIPEPSGTKKVAGQTCEVYVIENVGTACMWNGLVLEKQISIMGVENNKLAVFIELDKEISKDRFELPAGIIVTN